MDSWKRQGSLSQYNNSDSLSINHLTVSGKAIISELEINNLQLLSNSLTCFNHKVSNNLSVTNNIISNNIFAENEIIADELKIVNNAIIKNLFINNTLKLNNNLILNNGKVHALCGDLISENNVISNNGNIITNNGNIISSNNIFTGEGIVAKSSIETDGVIKGNSLILIGNDNEENSQIRLIVEGDIQINGKVSCKEINTETKDNIENNWLHLDNFTFIDKNIIPYDKENIVISTIIKTNFVILNAYSDYFIKDHIYKIYCKSKNQTIIIGEFNTEESALELGNSKEFNKIHMEENTFIELKLIYWYGKKKSQRKWILTQRVPKEKVNLELDI